MKKFTVTFKGDIMDENLNELREDIRTIMQKTSDFQRGDILVDSDGVEINLDYLQDYGHTRACLKDLFERLKTEFV